MLASDKPGLDHTGNAAAAASVRAGERLFVLFFNCGNWFEVLGFENLAAVETFNVFHAVSPRYDLGTGMLACVLHKARLRHYSTEPHGLVKGLAATFSKNLTQGSSRLARFGPF